MLDNNIEILLVEDDKDDALILQRFLHRHPDASRIRKCHLVESLDEACIFLSQNTVDLILLDLSLPDSTGFETFREIHERHSGVPVIILSGLNDSNVARELILCGVQDYLIKSEMTSDQVMRSIVYALKRHTSDLKLRESEIRYRDVLNSISDCIWSAEIDVDGHYRFRYCSPASQAVFGRPPKFFREWSVDWYSIIYPEDRGRLASVLGRILRGECGHEVQEYRVITREGKVKWIRQSVGTTRIPGGGLALSGVSSDITERKQLDEFRDQFAGVVSHEIRTPLAIIGGAIENLSDGLEGDLNSGQQQLLLVAQKNVKRLQKIISDMLDLTRLESGCNRFMRQEVDFRKLLGEFVGSVENLAQQNRPVRLKVDVSKDTPHVWADPEVLINLLNNLVSNAIRFANSQVCITARPEGDSVVIGVTDDGEGIPKEEQHLLFDKFVQLGRRADATGYRGTGLGLTICRELVRAMQGKIWVESETGKGASFFFMLPGYVEARDFFSVLHQEILDFGLLHPSFGLLAITFPEKLPEGFAPGVQNFQKFLKIQVLRSHDRVYGKDSERSVFVLASGERLVLRSLLQRLVAITQDEFGITVKANLACYPDDADHPTQLIACARESEKSLLGTAHKKKILFIDDEGDLIHVLVSRFTRQGFHVDVALNGESGLKKAEEFCPDAIFLDVFMDKMDGWEVCRRLRKIPQTQKTPIIMVTAHQGDGFEALAREHGADCLLQKPASSKQLIEVANRYLQ